jgi:putative transcriptional regulator
MGAVRRHLAAAAAGAAVLIAHGAVAQQADPPNGVLLVARSGIDDANFSQTVILVSQTREGETVGVILNRPTSRRHENGEPIYFGGPVMGEVLLALFRADDAPQASAFHVLHDVYLTMNPANIDALVARPGQVHRLYAGFSGWAPGQLESEIERGDWLLLPASEALLFRKDTQGMWLELWQKAYGKHAAATIFRGD